MKTRMWIVVLFLAFSCSEDIQPEPKSGYFTLTQLKASKGGRTAVAPVEFDLGELKASREFYFLLGNGGETPITDITIETDNEAFIVSPNKISSLAGINSSTTSIIPLISLGVVHGVNLNGVGSADLLEKGINQTIVSITGKTTENGNTITVSSEFKFKAEAKKMDIQLFDGATEIDLKNPTTFSSGVPAVGGIGALPGYYAPSNEIKIKNTGNVEIEVGMRLCCMGNRETKVTIQPNNSATFTLPADINTPEYRTTIFSLNGKGTVSDPSKIQLGTDGVGYFMIN